MSLAKNKGEMKVKDIQNETNHSSGSFSTYRKRLKEKGLIDTSEYGKIKLTLPRFGDVVKTYEY